MQDYILPSVVKCHSASNLTMGNALPVAASDWLKNEMILLYDGNHQVRVCVKLGVSYGRNRARCTVGALISRLAGVLGKSLSPSAGKPLRRKA